LFEGPLPPYEEEWAIAFPEVDETADLFREVFRPEAEVEVGSTPE